MLAAVYSMRGFIAAWRHEEAIRQELLCSILLVFLAVYLGNNNIEYILMIGSVLLVVLVELLNSAIEAVVDRVGLEHNELSGRAKDMGSAAVFIALALVVLTWGLILL